MEKISQKQNVCGDICVKPELRRIVCCWRKKATDTEENFRYSKEVLKEHGYQPQEMTIAVVSNDFHLFRASVLAKREGLVTTGVGAPIPWLHFEINYYIREAFALVKTYFL